MWDSAGHVATAVVSSILSAAFVGAVAAAYVKIINARHLTRRAVRQDEIDVLHRDIEDLRKDRDGLRVEIAELRKERDKEMSELKSEHTACLIEQERLRAGEKYLREAVDELKAEVATLRNG
jgi:predicted  nucleic acid-binding Zn-ribbon protein